MQTRHALVFLRKNAFRVFLISALLLVPCFWHKRIEAGDLPSHTYNAWLALLIHQGKAPGLYIASRWNNILVDLTLEKLGALLGFIVAERILVVLCVLIFFWGAFALIGAANQRPPWYRVPAIAMITYGWTFNSGFMNFYLSLGLAFFAAALMWRGNKADWLVAALLAVLVLMAHPLGLVCLIGLAAYFRLADALRGWLRWALFASAFLAVLLVHFYTLRLRTVYWHTKDFYLMNGVDQLVLFQSRYVKLAASVFVFGVICFFYGFLRERKWHGDKWMFRAPLELWAVLLFTAAMIPEVLWFSKDPMPFALAISRLTSVTAILAICALGSFEPRLWHLAGFAVLASVFFVWTYEDTGTLNDMERQVETMVSALPYGRRIVETINSRPDSRLRFIEHIVDRACIGKCFTYANYEPPAGQFRIRVKPGSPIVTDSVEDSLDMETGFYVVRPQDLPMNQIYQCDEKDLSKLCIRDLAAGEENGRLGYRPARFQ
jgi:hypothetical protein